MCLNGDGTREASSQAWVAVAEADFSRCGGGVKGNLAAWRLQGAATPALLIDRNAHDLVDGRRRFGLLRRAEAQVIENLLDGDGVVEVGHDLTSAGRTKRLRLAAPRGSRKRRRHQYMSPPAPIPAELFSPFASGISQMMASVVSSSDAMDAAFCKA